MKYLVIYWIWIDCTISITIEKFDSFDFTKTYGLVFYLNEHKCVEKNHFVEKLPSLKDDKIMFEAFVSKSILYVYQNARWNQWKTTPKIYQNIPKK
jgi:hypothetical protein